VRPRRCAMLSRLLKKALLTPSDFAKACLAPFEQARPPSDPHAFARLTPGNRFLRTTAKAWHTAFHLRGVELCDPIDAAAGWHFLQPPGSTPPGKRQRQGDGAGNPNVRPTDAVSRWHVPLL